MNSSRFKAHCLALPGVTTVVQWEDHLLFKVAGKMFAIAAPAEGTIERFSFKTSPDSFHILTQMPGISASRYLARSHWVSVDGLKTLPGDQLAAYLERSYRLVVAGLPKKTQAALAGGNSAEPPKPKVRKVKKA
jgi:predicted DNA-binding protein (MmcQ/YjbR family)